MKKKSRRRGWQTVIFSGVLLLLSGCGNKNLEPVPKLIDPAASNLACRPVELGSIGTTKVLYGTVTPVEYCCFFEGYVGIAEITVTVGDYVEEGDVVAYADVDMAKEQLNDLIEQLKNENQNYEINRKIAELRIRQIEEREMDEAAQELEIVEVIDTESRPELTKKSEEAEDAEESEESNDTEETEDLEGTGKIEDPATAEDPETMQEPENLEKNSRAVEEENMLYDEILHNYRVEKLQEKIDVQQKIIAEGTLKASHSGQVIYTKNLSESTDAGAYENIVMLADLQDTCIELMDTTIGGYDYEDYEVKYIQLEGKAYDVTELSYGMEVKVLAKAGGTYPNVRLVCPDAGKLPVGTTCPIFYREKKLEEVPIIGLDSLNGEVNDYFVYVKNEMGEREKRAVTIGEKDKYYVQVLSGLEIGEAVYYESNARIPAEYDTYTVKLSDYTIENKSMLYDMADEKSFWYDAKFDGTIDQIAVKKGDDVKEGDLLYVIESPEGKAALAAAGNDVNRETQVHKKNMAQFEESIQTEEDMIQKQILVYQKELEEINHGYRLKQLQKIYNDMAKNNDGTGKISIYAMQAGSVSEIKEEGFVEAGSHILSVKTVAEDKLLVKMAPMEDNQNYPNHIAGVGSAVAITSGDKVYQGVCIGMTAHQKNNLNKNYVTMTEEGAAISHCAESGYSYPAFYVEMEDKSFYEKMPKGMVTFPYIEMKNIVTVPTAIVQEANNQNDPTKRDYFVWRVVGDELIKQYIMVDKKISDINTTVVLSGIKAQDILAREK